jgi:hypothetical protein
MSEHIINNLDSDISFNEALELLKKNDNYSPDLTLNKAIDILQKENIIEDIKQKEINKDNKWAFIEGLADVSRLEKLKKMKLGHYRYYVNTSLGYYPYFSMELRTRIKKKKVINVVVTVEAGDGKSYMGGDLCRVLAPKTFTVDDIVFLYEDFLRCVLTSPRGTPIEYDEPSYAMSKKDWFKEVVKALVKTIESFRFKGKPLFLPIINKALLEKDIRSYLLQYQVVMKDRGDAITYRLFPSQFTQKTYQYEICKLKYGLFDNNLCDRDSCLGCNKLFNRDLSKRCNIFRAQYERKKANIQDKRYVDDMEEAKNMSAANMTIDEIEQIAMQHFDKFYLEDKNKIDVDLMVSILWRENEIDIKHSYKYRLAKQIEYDYPELFNPKPKINKNNAENA